MTSLLCKSLAVLRVPGNCLGYQLRSRLRWSRGALGLAHENKAGLFDWLAAPHRAAAARREGQLRERYCLAALSACSSRLHYAENLALLDAFEPLLARLRLPVGPDDVLRAADVGSGLFQYATALHRILARSGVGDRRRVILRGIEVDGHGIYRDLHSRADHARAHAALASGDVSFEVADFIGVRLPEQDVVTMLFPFLTAYPLLQWGLPLGLHRPRRLLRRAVQLLRVGGLLVVANQTEDEFRRLRQLLRDQPVELVEVRALATQLVPYSDRTADRHGSVWVRRQS